MPARGPRSPLMMLAACVAAAVGIIALSSSARAASADVAIAQRTAAARQTVENNPACRAIRPFYWAIGDAGGPLADDRVGVAAPRADTRMAIASASKLVYGAWVGEQRGGDLTRDDVEFLHFTSGYTEFDRCLKDQTVAECQSLRSRRIHNGGHVAANDGRFFYSGGHMQKHATLMGLGPDDDAALASDIGSVLGVQGFEYLQPQLAGGMRTSAADYGRLLQRIVAGQLKMRGLLGTHAVCTNPATCPTAAYTPVPPDESWHYSIGHWVEDDPVAGDGAFSSAGAFGFYPWIDASKRWWGVLARVSADGLDSDDPHQHPGAKSVYCGREIRAAWVSGQAR
jgi:hypothetical protein